MLYLNTGSQESDGANPNQNKPQAWAEFQPTIRHNSFQNTDDSSDECSAYGTGSFRTFNGTLYYLQSTCFLVLSRFNSLDPNSEFDIKIQRDQNGNFKKIKITVDKLDTAIENGVISVDGQRVSLPYDQKSIHIHHYGIFVRLESRRNFLSVYWEPQGNNIVKVWMCNDAMSAYFFTYCFNYDLTLYEGYLEQCGLDSCKYDVAIIWQSSQYVQVLTAFDMDLQIQVAPVMQLYVTLPVDTKGSINGLCGNVNGIVTDEFTACSGIMESTADAFAKSWATNAECKPPSPTPCIRSDNEKYANEKCALLKDPNGVFAKCHSHVSYDSYIKDCIASTCNCENVNECLCTALENYAKECSRKGLRMTGWRGDQCAVYCDYYNEPDGRSWNYEPCGPRQVKTCSKNTDKEFYSSKLEGMLGLLSSKYVARFEKSSRTTYEGTTVMPPYTLNGIQLESTGSLVRVFINEISSWISLNKYKEINIKIPLMYFKSKTEGQCGEVGGKSCLRANGKSEADTCCATTAYDWVISNPKETKCVQNPPNLPCSVPTTPPIIPPTPPVVPPCNILYDACSDCIGDVLVREIFHLQLHSVVDGCLHCDSPLVMGHFSMATVTDRDGCEDCVGPHGSDDHGKSGSMFLDFAKDECSVFGTGSIKTFNSTLHYLQSTCTFVLSRSDSAASNAEFDIIIKRDMSGAFTKIQVTIDKTETVIENGNIFVDGESVSLPYDHKSIHVNNFGIYKRIESRRGFLSVFWDTSDNKVHTVWVQLRKDYRGKTVGLCGKYGVDDSDLQQLTEDNKISTYESCETETSESNCEETTMMCQNDISYYFFSCLPNDLIWPYMELCGKDTCNCANPAKCACAIYEEIVRQCPSDGIAELSPTWRDSQHCDSVVIFWQLSTYVQVQTSFGLKLQVQMAPNMQLYITLPVEAKGSTKGLCGNYNDKITDEFISSTGILEHSADNFAESWATGSCEVIPPPICIRSEYVEECPATQHFLHNAFACNRTCRSLAGNDYACDVEDVPVDGCGCLEGQYMNQNGLCISKEECPCYYEQGMVHPGSTEIEGQNCTCSKGMWECTQKDCPGKCQVYGDGHYQTFDLKWYSYDGNCEYSLVEDYCGKDTGNFRITVESVPCCEEALTCSRAVTIELQDTEIELSDSKLTEKRIGSCRDNMIEYSAHTVGLYIIITTSSGITLIWDKHTRLTVILDPRWKGQVCGLCGNFDSDPTNDFKTRGKSLVTNVVEFGNSWKFDPSCGNIVNQSFPCEKHWYCSAWAQRRCSIIKDSVFQPCHNKVDPQPYYDVCVQESCVCEMEGRFLGFCTAVAAYAEACNEAEVCIKWRTPDLCPVFCDYYNEPGACSWHYEPCGTPAIKTCSNNEVGKKYAAKLEGKCEVFGDPHYLTFSGVQYAFLSDCTYILVQEKKTVYGFSVAVDNYYCIPGLKASCAKGMFITYLNNSLTLTITKGNILVDSFLSSYQFFNPAILRWVAKLISYSKFAYTYVYSVMEQLPFQGWILRYACFCQDRLWIFVILVMIKVA
ncbi:MUC19 protein, partial [Polypterus senegalus]